MSVGIYALNQQCMMQISGIVASFRKQAYCEGSDLLIKLTEGLSNFSEVIVELGSSGLDIQEWSEILRAIVKAQENQDYILIADILEGDLLPYLQRLQLQLQMLGAVSVPEYWDANMESIKNTQGDLWKEISSNTQAQSGMQGAVASYEPMLAINGQLTLKALVGKYTFCMHSTINPQREAELLVESLTESGNEEYWVLGMGLGYHVRAILEKDSRNRVTILENDWDVLKMALTYTDWRSYFADGRMRILYEPDIFKLIGKLKEKNVKAEFFIYYPSLRCVRDAKAKELLEDYFVTTSTMREQGRALDRNFYMLQKKTLPECEKLRDVFEGKRVVIVGGGPSVDIELENIGKYREKIVLVAVGTIARKLLDNGITPDVIVITEPWEGIYQQVEGLPTKNIPLVLLATASETLLSSYEGPIYIAYQEGYEASEKIAEEKGYMLFSTGGSVSTLAIDMAIKFGAEELILVGMDMAYTGGRSHAEGIGCIIRDTSQLRCVLAVGGKMVYTSKNLDIYRKWIERRIEGAEALLVYNTSKGARIQGTIEMGMDEIFGN